MFRPLLPTTFTDSDYRETSFSTTTGDDALGRSTGKTPVLAIIFRDNILVAPRG